MKIRVKQWEDKGARQGVTRKSSSLARTKRHKLASCSPYLFLSAVSLSDWPHCFFRSHSLAPQSTSATRTQLSGCRPRPPHPLAPIAAQLPTWGAHTHWCKVNRQKEWVNKWRRTSRERTHNEKKMTYARKEGCRTRREKGRREPWHRIRRVEETRWKGGNIWSATQHQLFISSALLPTVVVAVAVVVSLCNKDRERKNNS